MKLFEGENKKTLKLLFADRTGWFKLNAKFAFIISTLIFIVK